MALAAGAVALLAAGLIVKAPTLATAAPQGCGYGTGGPHASVLCWIDMSGFNPTLAESAAGQRLTIDLGSGTALSFTVKVSAGEDGLRPIAADALPTYSTAVLGNGYYRNVPGKPALYTALGSATGAVTKVSLSNISATRNGVPITSNYSFVMADAETTEQGEGFVWASSSNLKLLAEAIPAGWSQACDLTGIGTKTITCDSPSTATNRPGAMLVYADSPGEISSTFKTSSTTSRQAVAFAVMVSSVDAQATVASRHAPTDSFSVSASSANISYGQKATGSTNTAQTGAQPVLTDNSGSSITFRVDMDAGSPSTWSDYRVAWACNNAAKPSETVSVTTAPDGRSVTTTVKASDEIRCSAAITSRIATLTLQQSVTPPVATAVGQTESYAFDVTNTGDETLTNLSIVQGPFTGSGKVSAAICPSTPLLPGASARCTANYTVTRADMASSPIRNTATARAVPATMSDPYVLSNESTATFEVVVPGLELVKNYVVVNDTNGNGINDAGDVIKWTFDVTNSGNISLNNIAITDELLEGLGIAVSCAATPLAAGATVTCGSGHYTITAADVLTGQIRNVATATGQVPDGTPGSPANPTSVPAEATTSIEATPVPGLAMVKNFVVVSDANANGINDPGDVVKWTFDVTNTGNTPLNTISITDDLLDSLGLSTSCAAGPLAAGGSMTCESGEYTITAADVLAGEIYNVATATGQVPAGTPGNPANPVSASSAVTIPVEATPAPALELVKDYVVVDDTNGNGIIDPGDVVKWTFEVTNTGNTSLNDVTIGDDLLDELGIPVTCAATSLVAGAATICESGDYTITAADVLAGEILNVATATGQVPAGTPGNPANPISGSSEVAIPVQATPVPGLTLVKNYVVVDDANNNGINDPGDVIKWTFEVTNSGNVTLNGVGVIDDLLAEMGVGVSCDPAPLAAGSSVTCDSEEYTLTGADVKAGAIHNVASATGQVPAGTPGNPANPTSAFAEVTAPIEATPVPGIELEKNYVVVNDANTNGINDAGDVIKWTFKVLNSGNTTLNDVAITDELLDGLGVDVTCDTAPLAAGASTVCESGDYTITDADVQLGKIRNVATATGQVPAGTPGSPANPTSESAEVTVSLNPLNAALDMVKTAHPSGNAKKVKLDDTIDYSFKLTNVGSARLTGVSVKDPLLEKAGIAVICPATELAPGASVTCRSEKGYRVTAKDVANGKVLNRATGHATPPPLLDPIAPAASEATVKTAQADTVALSSTLAVTGAGTPLLLTMGGLAMVMLGVIAMRTRRRVR
ncbi:hypothetical protein G7068_08085 [Leucobacter viscericola]|uniref:DUF11 domain-containing protein n=1 Tax=Leucobacter viscericola TaxID=2714935 RepID=A0A6G7XEX1_9MICO|nr:hypothetical protein [Leucobacter viscericola]QIK63160.1 hypothetical protein G7068_08085 [Leucobacter viscericola]